MNLKTTLHKISHIIPVILLGLALMIVYREIKRHDLNDISESIHNMPWQLVAASIVLMFISYAVLAAYDVLALRYTGHRHLGMPKIMLTSLISYAISNNTGHAWAAGGSVRYRFYTAWGVPGWDILKISLFLGLTYLIGVMTMGLGSALLLPDNVKQNLENPHMIMVMLVSSAAFLAVYWGAILLWRKPINIKGVEFNMPSPLAGLCQTLVSCVDLVLAAWVLWMFMDGHVSFSFETFLVIFILAQLAGLLSQVPGGIGVFEGAFLWLLSGTITQEEHLVVVGALVIYRLVYYFLPLVAAGIGLFSYEMYTRRQALQEGWRMLILALFKPSIFRYERKTVIKAPVEKLFPLISDLRLMQSWSPWEKMDPDMQRIFSGAEAGVGAAYEWHGNRDIGQGRMEIAEIIPLSKVIFKLEFIQPFRAHNISEFTLQPQGDNTLVRWVLSGPHAYMANLMSVFIDSAKISGDQFEVGLENLKIIAEQ